MSFRQDQSSQLLGRPSKPSLMPPSSSLEQLGDKIMMYTKCMFWLCLAIGGIYYSNFFHNLFRNPNINQVFFQISMAGYTMIVMLMLYASIVLPYCYGVKSIEDYNPKLIPIGAVVGVISVFSLLVAIWPVWGATSLLLFVVLWKGFFSLPAFLPSGPIEMGFGQDSRARLISNIMRTFVVVGFAGVIGVLLYKLSTAESQGRQRALEYEKEKGKKKGKSLVPEELQPQYIEKQRRKYRASLESSKSEQLG